MQRQGDEVFVVVVGIGIVSDIEAHGLVGRHHGQGLIVRQSGKKLIRGTEGQVNRMSDDLISRKAVIAAVDRHTREDGTLDDDISVILEEVKTAFDKEKVVKQIEDYRDLVPEWALKEIIEIVKKKEG